MEKETRGGGGGNTRFMASPISIVHSLKVYTELQIKAKIYVGSTHRGFKRG